MIFTSNTVATKLNDRKISTSNLCHEKLREYLDRVLGFSFDEYKEQLGFFMDSLDGSDFWNLVLIIKTICCWSWQPELSEPGEWNRIGEKI